jgi:hypothetical protein
MGTASIHFDPWSLAWRGLWRRLAPRCALPGCIHTRSLWGRLRGAPGIVIQGLRYCVDGCLERALADALWRAHSAPKRAPGPHRIPLGLLLLSRQQLTAEQLRAGLTAQRAAGRGRIGEWLQTLGFVSEQQVTAALARQWSCPVLRTDSALLAGRGRIPQIPVALLESVLMVPVAYVAATATLHVAFSEGIDYGVLYALEQMLRCRTEPCLAVPSLLRRRLQTLIEQRGESEILFDRVADVAEFARIVGSYSVRLAASEIRMATCGRHVWVRLLRPAGHPLDLLLRSPGESAGQTSKPGPGAVPTV